MPSPTLRSARPNTGADPELAAALRRCAERDPGGLADLEARCGQRLRAVLVRALGDVALADRALPAALADLEEHAAEFDPDREAAEDWIFGRTRCRLRALSASGKADATRRVRVTRRPSHGAGGRRGSPAADPPGAVPRPMAGGATAPDRPVPSRPGPSSRPAETTPEHRDGRAKRALSTVTAGLLVASAMVAAFETLVRAGPPAVRQRAWSRPADEPRPSQAATRRLERPPVPPPEVDAGVPGRPPDAAPHDAAPPPAPQVPADLAAQGGPPVVGSDLPSGGASAPHDPPPAAPEPIAAVPFPGLAVSRLPPEPPPEVRPSPEPALPASPRVFVHYSASGATDAALAQSLAERLRQEGFAVAGVRAVPFSIGAGSVRYFFAGDLGEARRLLASFNDYLGRQARPAARGPADFTRYDPKPVPGTIELWIPHR